MFTSFHNKELLQRRHLRKRNLHSCSNLTVVPCCSYHTFVLCYFGDVHYNCTGRSNVELNIEKVSFTRVVAKTVNVVLSICCLAHDGTAFFLRAYFTFSKFFFFLHSTNEVLN